MLEPRISAPPSYGLVAKGLHWLIVALLLVQFALAWTMPGMRQADTSTLVNLHFSFGMLVLPVVLARLGWRLTHPVPLLNDTMPAWQHRVAESTHWLLYLLLFLSPILGWAAANARGFDVALFGIAVPALLGKSSFAAQIMGTVHQWLSYGLLGTIGAHVTGALYHHFLLRDETLKRMLPHFG